jgi:hypothetical protein
VNHTNKVRSLRWLAGLAFTAIVAACGGGGSGGVASDGSADALAASAARPGTAASCSFDHVFVTVDQLRLVQLVNGVEQSSDVALATPTRIDLVNLSGALLQTLGAAPLPAGEFTQIQLILSPGTDPLANAAQPTGGSLTPLAVPAGTQSGLKVQGDFVVPSGQTGDVALQGFNACQAVVQTGSPSSPSFQLKPNLTAQASIATVSASGGSAEFRVNTTTALSQELPKIARLRDGGYVIAWATAGSNFEGIGEPRSGVFFQRYAANGTPAGAETRADDFNTFQQHDQVHVAALADGGFVVGWHLQQVTDGGQALQFRRFSADGTRGFFRQDPVTLPAVIQFDLAGLSDGGYVRVVAAAGNVGSGLSYQRFGADNAPLGDPLPVTDLRDFNGPSVTGTSDGGFIVAWEGFPGTSTLSTAIYTRRFGADGLPAGPETVVSADTHAANPTIAQLTGGGYVVTWITGALASNGVPSTVVMQRMFNADGSPATAATRVDEANDIQLPACTPSPIPGPCAGLIQQSPYVAALDDGGFVVTYETVNRPGTIYARRYNAQGAAVSGVTEVPSSPPITRAFPVAAGIANDGFVIAWEAFGQDGDRWGIYAKQYGAAGLLGAAVP